MHLTSTHDARNSRANGCGYANIERSARSGAMTASIIVAVNTPDTIMIQRMLLSIQVVRDPLLFY